MDETALDNPAWGALTTEHALFAEGTEDAKRYRAGIVPFIACRAPGGETIGELDPFMAAGEAFYIIGDLPPLPANWAVENELACAQMLFGRSDYAEQQLPESPAISTLENDDAAGMFELINSVQPGYYERNTRLLGVYAGIKKDGKLVAMAGERMRMTGFAELSAICTHRDYRGLGYAQSLVAHLCNLHAANNIQSFLHVALYNNAAIRLYERAGFYHRRSIYFYRVRKRFAT